MDMLDRYLGYEAWTLRYFIERCRELTPFQLHQPFDIGHGTVHGTINHIIGNIEVWTDLMRERPVRKLPSIAANPDSYLHVPLSCTRSTLHRDSSLERTSSMTLPLLSSCSVRPIPALVIHSVPNVPGVSTYAHRLPNCLRRFGQALINSLQCPICHKPR